MTDAARPGDAGAAPEQPTADAPAAAPPSPVGFLTSGPAILRRWVLAEVIGSPAPGLRHFARRRRAAPSGREG